MVELNFLGVFKKTTFNNEEPPLFELRDLTIFKYPQKINYHKIIKEFDISPYFIEEKTPKDITDKKKEEKQQMLQLIKLKNF